MNNDYAKFFLDRKVGVYQLECIELYHPSFLETYRVVRNDDRGVYVQHAPDSGQIFYEYMPVSIERSGMLGDLDQTLKISISGLGTLLPDEFERVREGQYATIKPTVNFRIYSSTDLTKPMYYLYNLQLAGVAMDHQAVTFQAESPRLNNAKTGDIYSLDRFSALRGAI